MENEFSKMLDLSTAHLTPTTIMLLDDTDEGDVDAFRHVPHKHGFILFATNPAEDNPERWEHFPELRAIMQYAYDGGCILINFDQDADIDEQFETFF